MGTRLAPRGGNRDNPNEQDRAKEERTNHPKRNLNANHLSLVVPCFALDYYIMGQ
ncbi:MAG: hypothetical protein ACC628_25480 [Pirellulaceae bacterium]